jgi:hypothetical protein
MTKLEVMKLKHYRDRLGPMTSNEALTIALGAEQTRLDIGAFDPAASHFTQEQIDFLNYAELLEKEENWKKENADADRAGLF